MSLISQSYVVLYISLGAHLCQFLFLGFVENPRKKLKRKIINYPNTQKKKKKKISIKSTTPSQLFLMSKSNKDRFFTKAHQHTSEKI